MIKSEPADISNLGVGEECIHMMSGKRYAIDSVTTHVKLEGVRDLLTPYFFMLNFIMVKDLDEEDNFYHAMGGNLKPESAIDIKAWEMKCWNKLKAVRDA